MPTFEECIENSGHYDPDNRYMAISDLIDKLNAGEAIDDRLEER